MRVSAYERVASMLIAVLVLVGSAVGLLLIVWLSIQAFGSRAAVPVQYEEIGTGEGSLGESEEFDTPAGEEIEFEEPQVEQTLAAVADAVALRAATLDDPALTDQPQAGSGRGGFGRTPGSGGRPGRAVNWEILFPEGATLETYARQLDFFGIELGVLLPGDQVAYAYNLSKQKPDSRTGPRASEKRFYLTWRRGDLEQADRELLTRAGIDSAGKTVLKFLPTKTEQALAALERAKAGAELKNVRKTRFGVRSDGNGYAFYVIDQSIGYLQSRL